VGAECHVSNEGRRARARHRVQAHLSRLQPRDIIFSLLCSLSAPQPPDYPPTPILSLSCVAILLCKLYVSPHNNVNRAGNSLAASREAASFMVRGSASETFDRILMYLGHDAAFNAYS
jgi:hypothetical protein